MPINQKLLAKLPNLKEMVIYIDTWHEENDEETKKTLADLRVRLPAVTFTWEEYV